MIVPVQRKLRQRRSCCSSGSELARLGSATLRLRLWSPYRRCRRRLNVSGLRPLQPPHSPPLGLGWCVDNCAWKDRSRAFFFLAFYSAGCRLCRRRRRHWNSFACFAWLLACGWRHWARSEPGAWAVRAVRMGLQAFKVSGVPTFLAAICNTRAVPVKLYVWAACSIQWLCNCEATLDLRGCLFFYI